MSQREYLDGPVALTIDERQRKWSEAYAANIWRVLDRILRRPLTDSLDYLQEMISVPSAEAFTPRLVEGDLSEMFRFRRRVEAIGHRNSARAFRSTSSAEINSTSPASICAAR